MDSGRRPRLCHIMKRQDFDGYGFNLHAEKHKTGHYIGRVEDNSPAAQAGLLEGDRLIEVNSTSVLNYTHAQVVNAIKSVPDETKLLVVDPLTDQYFEDENIPINGALRNILYLSSEQPLTTPDVPTNVVSRSGSLRQSIANIFSSKAVSENKLPSPNVNAKPRPSKLLHLPPANLVKCHLETDKDFKGYGFDLHNTPPGMQPGEGGAKTEVLILEDASKPPDEQTEEGIPFEGAHYVGQIELGSPAEKAGMRQGDMIYQVGKRMVSGLGHDEVVHLIRVDPSKADIVVVRKIDENWNPASSRGQSFCNIHTIHEEENGSEITSNNSNDNDNPNYSQSQDSQNINGPSQLQFQTQGGNTSRNAQQATNSPLSRNSNLAAATPLAAGIAVGASAVAANSFNRNSPSNNRQKPVQNGMSSNTNIGAGDGHVPLVKLCHLRKWPDFQGYGFNLHAGTVEIETDARGRKHERTGHFIGKVDPDSPAAAVGLAEGDRVIEVNTKNVEDTDHKSVVNMIKSDPERACLLLVSQRDYDIFQATHTPIDARWANVIETFSSYPDGRPSRTGSINKKDRTAKGAAPTPSTNLSSALLIGGAPISVDGGPARYHDGSDFKAYNQASSSAGNQLTGNKNHSPTRQAQQQSPILNVAAERTPDWERGRGSPRGASNNSSSSNNYQNNYKNPNNSPTSGHRHPRDQEGRSFENKDRTNYGARGSPTNRFGTSSTDGVERVPVGSTQDYGANRIIGSGDHEVNNDNSASSRNNHSETTNSAVLTRDVVKTTDDPHASSFSATRSTDNTQQLQRGPNTRLEDQKVTTKYDGRDGPNKIDISAKSPNASHHTYNSINSNKIANPNEINNSDSGSSKTYLNSNAANNSYGAKAASVQNSGGRDVWNMSASEYKARLLDGSDKKRRDPKFDTRTLKEKYEILQQM